MKHNLRPKLTKAFHSVQFRNRIYIFNAVLRLVNLLTKGKFLGIGLQAQTCTNNLNIFVAEHFPLILQTFKSELREQEY